MSMFSPLALLTTLSLLALLPVLDARAEAPNSVPSAIRRELLNERAVAGAPNLMTQLWLIEYSPGASAEPHQHPVAGIGYVLEGAFDSAFGAEAVVRVSAGQSFIDPPTVQHRVFRNASTKQPLKFLIAYTIPHGTPIVDFSRTVQLKVEPTPLRIASPALYPETIEVNPRTRQFLVSSVREGAVYQVGLDGRAKKLVEDARLTSILGIAVHAPSNRLLVTNSDIGVGTRRSNKGLKKEAMVASYDLVSGRALWHSDLTSLLPSGHHLLNGITVDPEGTAYVTDSLAPAIYRVDRNGNASLLLQDDEFKGPGINLNGIVHHPRGFLLTVKKSTGALYRIPLADPRQFSRINVPGNFAGADGLLLIDDKQLVVIANRTPDSKSERVFVLKSTDGWANAQVVDSQPLGDGYPTTCAALDGKLWALSSHLDEWLSAADNVRPELLKRGRRAEIRIIGAVGP